VRFPYDPGGSRTRDLRIKSCVAHEAERGAEHSHIVVSPPRFNRMNPEETGCAGRLMSECRQFVARWVCGVVGGAEYVSWV
jgi:hypothetical protein